MQFFLKAVVTGFGLSLGAALFKKVAPHLRLDDKPANPATDPVQEGGATDSGVQPQYS
jgi:hypothetical protein